MKRKRLLLLLALTAAPAFADQGKLWRQASAPFRRRAQAARHAAVAESIQRRRGLRSPFAPPVGDLPALGKTPSGAKVVGVVEGSLLLEEVEQQLKALTAAVDSTPADRILKSVDALGARMGAAILSSKSQRDRAAALGADLAKLKGRLQRRTAFATLNPRVRFIIWAPPGEGEGTARSLAVVNQCVLHEGDTLVPGVTVARILQHEVRFDLGGEQVAVGLK